VSTLLRQYHHEIDLSSVDFDYVAQREQATTVLIPRRSV
jgi:hypothetical protein